MLRYHPFLGFLWFVPTFLVCELIAAGAMWLIYASRQSDTDDDGPDDLNRLRGRVKHEGGQVKLEPLESSDEAESTVSGLSEREGAGFRRGMTAVEGTETEEEEEEEGFSESASQAGEYGAEEEAALAVKPEEGDDARTIGGVSSVVSGWMSSKHCADLCWSCTVRHDPRYRRELWPIAGLDLGDRHLTRDAPFAPEWGHGRHGRLMMRGVALGL